VLYYNPKDTPVTKTVTISPDLFAEWKDVVVTPEEGSWKLTIEPHSIAAINFAPAPQELQLECESFTDISAAKPLSSTDCSPGRGVTCVRIPAEASITTRFPVDVPGNYTIFTRCIINSNPTAVDVIVDGQPVAPVDAKAGLTILAGTVNLGKGAHTLTLKPRNGRAVRADFVLLSTDPSIAGYNFGVKTANIE
jgi:hypothetical protein